MEFLIILVPFLIALLLSNWLIPYIILVTYKKRLFDPIDSRKLHQTIVPRLGGVAFVPIQCMVLAITAILLFKIPVVAEIFELNIKTWLLLPMFLMYVCGVGLLYLVGIADDLMGVGYKLKFFVQFLASGFLPLSGLWINDLYGLGFIVSIGPWVGIPFTMFLVVLIINAINLIDGLDGLCSGVVSVACLVLGSLFVYYGAWIHAMLAFITLGVLIPFFYYNVFGASKRRRRIFMGDTGSMTLGYTVAFLSISFAMNYEVIKPFSEGAIVVAASVLIVPVFDVARVMLVRKLTGHSMFKADRNHLHHKFLRSGMSHRVAMLSIVGLSLFFCIFNIVLVQFISNNILLVLNFILWLVLTFIFNHKVNSLQKKNI